MNKRLYPMLPLRDVVVYPHIIVPLFVGRSKSIAALDAAMAEDQELLLVPQRDAQTSEPGLSDLNTIGTFGRIVQMAKLSDGTVKVLVEGISRIRISEQTDRDTFKGAKSLMPETDSLTEEERKSLISLAVEQFGDYLKAHDRNPEELLEPLRQLGNPGQIADTIAAHMELDMKDRVHLLCLIDVAERIHQVLVLLAKAQEQFELDRNIKKRVKQQMERNQREYYLNEKIKAIQKELVELDEAQNEIDILEKRIKKAKMPQATEKKACGELNKLKQMPSLSAEANVIRNYLEWMIDFPWSKRRRSQYNLERAEAILDRDHYGLKDVKERILEYLAVQKRNRGSKGPIICLVGPPGVGKTSLGKSIASATGRDFDRISLGGMHDEAEIRGHRRTYIGALPGKIVQKLCKLDSNNPLILLDEIDKIGNDHRGDPASALLEVLDPAQNNAFNDHYLETDIDLSRVLFIATANTLNIPGPLLDRMEVIRLPGYTVQEKIQIAKRYIVPRQRKENALKTEEFHLGEGVINTVIEDYTREAGVRNLEREIGKLARKSVRKLLDKNTQSILVDNSNLDDFLGVAKFHRSEEDRAPKIGSVTGLAWTSVGGELLQIESTAFPGKGQLTRTGQLGDVMQESIQAAMSVVRGYLEEHDEDFRFSDYDIHMHLPEGATPKDGPSAGIGMATALLSALSRQPVHGTLAMTGEITLRGRVLAIGGLKEKLLAALRGHLKTVLIPAENVKDLRDMPEEILSALEIVPVSHIDEVFARAFCDQNMPFKVRIPARPTHFTGTPMSNPTPGHC